MSSGVLLNRIQIEPRIGARVSSKRREILVPPIHFENERIIRQIAGGNILLDHSHWSLRGFIYESSIAQLRNLSLIEIFDLVSFEVIIRYQKIIASISNKEHSIFKIIHPMWYYFHLPAVRIWYSISIIITLGLITLQKLKLIMLIATHWMCSISWLVIDKHLHIHQFLVHPLFLQN